MESLRDSGAEVLRYRGQCAESGRSLSDSSLQGPGVWAEEEVADSREAAPPTRNRTDACMNSRDCDGTHRTGTVLNQTKSRYKEGEVDTKLHS